MYRIEAPKLKLPASKSETPNRHRTVPGMQKRLRQGEYSLLQTIADLGSKSDIAVLRNRSADLVQNRAFAEHQQKLRGAISRLAKVQIGNRRVKHDQVAMRKGVYAMADGDWQRKLPHRVEVARLKSAFQTWEDSIRGR